jgi:CheY-like chemotaxis protein
VRAARPGLVLLDLTMPVMDGFAFLRALRAMPGGDEVPVVVLSARDVSEEERHDLSAADRILRKGDASLQDVAAEVGRLGRLNPSIPVRATDG